MHLFTSVKNNSAGLELARQLGIKWDTAWLIKQNLIGPCARAIRSTSSTAICRLMKSGWTVIARVDGRRARKNPLSTIVNTGLGNIKCAITGSCRSFDTQHADRQLAAYEWRLNRRFRLHKYIDWLVEVTITPQPYRKFARARFRRQDDRGNQVE